MDLQMWQGASFTAWLSDDCPEHLQPKVLAVSTDEETCCIDTVQHSDAEQQSSTALRKRHCDLAELDSSSWDPDASQQPDSHSMKRMCSGQNSSCEAGSAQPFLLDPRSEPCSPGTLSPSCDASLHSSVWPDTPTGSRPASAAGVASPSAVGPAAAPYSAATAAEADVTACFGSADTLKEHRSLAAGTWQLCKGQGSGLKAVQPVAGSSSSSMQKQAGGKTAGRTTAASGRSSRSGSARAGASAGQQPSAAADSSKPAGKRPSRRSGGNRQATSQGAEKSGKHSCTSSSSCKGPRVRLGGRVLSPEEAEQYLKEAAAAAQALAAKAAAAKAGAVAASKDSDTRAAGAAKSTAAGSGGFSRAASPCLDALGAGPSGAAGGASPCLLPSPQSSCLSHELGDLAAIGSTEQQPGDAARMATDASLVCTADCTAAQEAVPDSLACDDLDMTDQLTDQLPADFIPTPNQYGWQSLEAMLGMDVLGTTAAAGGDAVIGSAGSAAGDSNSLAAAVQQQEVEHAVHRSPFQMACPAAAPGWEMDSVLRSSTSGPLGSATVDPMSRMHRCSSSSASLCAETLLLQHSSCNGSSLSNMHSMPINIGQCGASRTSLGYSAPASLSGFPSLAGSTQAGGMSCTSLNMLPEAAANAAAAAAPFALPRRSVVGSEAATSAVAAAEEAPTATAAAAAQQDEESIDAELQQLLAQWSPVIAAPAPAPTTSGAAAATECLSLCQQQQMTLPGLNTASDAAAASFAPDAATTRAAAFAANPQQQQQQQQLAWKPAFALPASGSRGAFSVPVMPPPPAEVKTNHVQIRISSSGLASLVTQGQAAATPAAAGSSPCAQRLPLPLPRAKKSKAGSGRTKSGQRQQQLQVQMQMQMHQAYKSSAAPAGDAATADAAAPQTRIVVHLKPNQQQQLMAMVDRIVQQRLAQSYQAGFRAASSQLTAVGGAAPGAAMTQGAGVPGALPAATAAAVQDGVMQLPVAVAEGIESEGARELLSPSMPKSAQLVDDILPSMQDLLTDCC